MLLLNHNRKIYSVNFGISCGAKNRGTKAELNRRSQACEVLTGTGISRRGNVSR